MLDYKIVSVVLSFVVISGLCACNDARVKSLVIDTPQNEYVLDSTGSAHLKPIQVRTVGAYGQYIPEAEESVSVSAASMSSIRLTSQSATSGVTSRGQMTFNLVASGANSGRYLLEFNLCGGSRFDYLILVFFKNDSAKMAWANDVGTTTTDYSFMVTKPQIGMVTNEGIFTDVSISGVWELQVNDSRIALFNNKVAASANSKANVSFSQLVIDTNGFVGVTFELSLKYAGSFSAQNTTIPFPPPIALTVVDCTHDGTIVPRDNRSSISHFILGAGSMTIPLKGWGFIREWSQFPAGVCRYGGVEYKMAHVDVCNVDCVLSGPAQPNSGMLLEYSLNGGLGWERVGTVRIASLSTPVLVPSERVLMRFRDELVAASVTFVVEDGNGNWLQGFSPEESIVCSTDSLFAQKAQVFDPFYNTRTGFYEAPRWNQSLVRGQATVDFVLGNMLEAGNYTFCCHTPSGLVGPACTTIRIVDECPSPPEIDTVQTDNCSVVTQTTFANCSAQPSTIITITGRNFGYEGTSIFIGSTPCSSTVHDPSDQTRILRGYNCPGRGLNNTIWLGVVETGLRVNATQSYSFVGIPRVTNVSGCAYDFSPSTAGCNEATQTITIQGEFFGAAMGSVKLHYYDPPGAIPYLTTTVNSYTDTKVIATVENGVGRRLEVEVLTATGESYRARDVTISFVASRYYTCPRSGGQQCNLKGVCNVLYGVCVCFHDAVSGYWSSAACVECQDGYFGPKCTSKCPVNATGSICSGLSRGFCDSGPSGTGLCQCKGGYGGFACDEQCPGGVASPCGGHGVCTQNTSPPTCACFHDPIRGHWGGSNCSVCDGVHTGAQCIQRCAGTTVACNGRGICAQTQTGSTCLCEPGFCGRACEYASCNSCDAGYFGSACTGVCPGTTFVGTLAYTCSSHGVCSEGREGTGECMCRDGYFGVDCSNRCPTTTTSACSGNGVCDVVSGTCRCNATWSGAACSATCPVYNGRMCNDNGMCSDGVNGTGLCNCFGGFTGAACNQECPGGYLNPCSNHGTCQADGTCLCQSDDTQGHWASDDCSVCDTGYFGKKCNGTCVQAGGIMCAGHGECSLELKCLCQASTLDGFWAQPDCQFCQPGYFGSRCEKECPGGPCNTCSQRGTCSDGLNGTGTCTCYNNATAGFFLGSLCDTCAPGYFGRKCNQRCPSLGGLECAGRGTCDSGVSGTGLCSCNQTASTGFWGGTTCDECASGYAGAGCFIKCYTDVNGSVCSGHGSCNDGLAGDGVCSCSAGYAAPTCAETCPRDASNTVCFGHGSCNNGVCTCYKDTTNGFWSTSSCNDCQASFYGSTCTLQCPVNSGHVCSNHGTCSDGVTGTGLCSCTFGWSGLDCSQACTGGSENPCGGHGICNPSDGTCTCFSNVSKGHWQGSGCTTCDPLYESAGCTTECPNVAGVVCNGYGTCYDGMCQCSSGYCGANCNTTGAACSSACPSGTYGATCSGQCPGGSSLVCNGHGLCSDGLTGSGFCSCYTGYWGSECLGICPLGPGAGTCTRRGQCNRVTGACECLLGFGGASCELVCPGGAGNVCSGHGTCAPSNATCICDAGYVTNNCSVECPGGAANPCGGHGQCLGSTGQCSCTQSASSGYWAGSGCLVCMPGFSGPNCTNLCVQGTTSGTQCVCQEKWSNSNCSSECPKTAAGYCNGKGTCSTDSTSDAKCQCFSGSYGPFCNITCGSSTCTSAPYSLKNFMCSSEGKCVCQDNSGGHFTDTSSSCTKCNPYYWGPYCDKSCPCLGRGTCGSATGSCSCLDSDVDGHFAGSYCERCKEGYIGQTCKSKNILITRQRPCSTIVTSNATSTFLLVDAANDLIMTGGRPVVLCRLSTRRFLGLRDVGGTVVAGEIASSTTIRLTVREGTVNIQDRVVEVERNDRPSLAILASGDAFNPAAVGLTLLGGHRLMSTSAYYTPIAPILVAQLLVNTNQSVHVYSTGRVAVFDGLNLVGSFDLSAHFSLIQSAAISSQAPPLLLIGGHLSGSWSLVTATLPLNTTSVITANITSALVAADSGICTSDNACLSVAAIVVYQSCPILTVLTSAGVVLVKFCLDSTTVVSGRLLDGYDTTAVFNVTAAVLDEYSNAFFLAINYATSTIVEPTTVYRISLTTLTSSGSVRFQQLGTVNEVVVALQPNNATRALFATVPMSFQMSVVPLNMYAVTRVFPELADTQGGLTLTVQGEGFAPNAVLECGFNGTATAATFVSTTEVRCVVPPGSSEACEGISVEVTVSSSQFTKNLLPLRRVPTPRLSRVFNLEYASMVDNAYGPVGGGETIVVEGFGFQDTLYLACRFTTPNGTFYSKMADTTYIFTNGVNGSRLDQASYNNVSVITCIQPAFPEASSGSVTVEVTLDGFVYTSGGLQFEVVSAAAGYAAFSGSGSDWTAVGTETYASSNALTLRSFDIFTIDRNGHRLRMLDSSSTHRLSMNLTNYTLRVSGSTTQSGRRSRESDCPSSITAAASAPVFVPNGTTAATAIDGVTQFAGGYFAQPPAGDFTLTFTDVATGWMYTYSFSIDVGEAHSIHICRQPPSTINNQQPVFTTQPTLYIEDIAGNQLSLKDLAGIRVVAEYLVESTVTTAQDPTDESNRLRYGVPVTVKKTTTLESRVAQARNDLLTFEGIEMTGIYGNTYAINFTGYNLINATSQPITVEFCKNNTAAYLAGDNVLMYFAKPGTSECFTCPSGALCDGTPNITLAQNNLWRPDSSSFRIYSCGYPYSGDSCLAPDGRCKEGYEGVRCSVCSPGYSKSDLKCEKCKSETYATLFLVVLLVVAVGFVSVLAFASFNSKVSDALTVVVKIAINHLQVSNRIPEVIFTPPVLKKLFSAQQQVSELIRFDIVSTTCPPLNLSTYNIFLLTIFLPLIIMAFFGVVFLVLHVIRQFRGVGPVYDLPACTNEKPVRRERVVMLVAQFIVRMRLAGMRNLGRPNRDDDRDYFFTAIQLFKATCIIALLLVYPSVLEKSASMWKCEGIVYGDGATYHVRHFLEQDRSIDCDTSTHKAMQYGSLAACIVYTFGIPALLTSLVYQHWTQHGRAHARRLFAFGVGGFNVRLWWWETVVMARKAAIVFVITFVGSVYVRTYLAMWAMSFALGLHVFAKPFERTITYYLEGLGIASIVIILNLSLLFQFDAFAEGTLANSTLVYVLYGITVFVWVMLGVALLYYAAKRIYHWATGTEESVAEFHVADADDENTEVHAAEATSLNKIGLMSQMQRASRPPEESQVGQAIERIVVDPKDLAVRKAETPFERLKRMQEEKKRLVDRRSHNKTQEDIADELRDAEHRLLRARALAEAEAAVLKASPHMEDIRGRHEATLQRLMMKIRQERGEVVSTVEHLGTARRVVVNNEGEKTSTLESTADLLGRRRKKDMEEGVDFDFSDVEGGSQELGSCDQGGTAPQDNAHQ